MSQNAIPIVKVRVQASEIARVSRERMILIAWGSQHTVVSTAPVIPMMSTSKLFMEP